MKKRIVPDWLNLKHEYLFKIIGKKGKYSLELKCLFLVVILYAPGLITTSLTGTWHTYIFDEWRRFFTIAAIGIFVWLMIRFLKKIDDKILYVNKIIAPPKRQEGEDGYEEWTDWEKKIANYKHWLGHSTQSWYYFAVILGIITGLIFNFFTNPATIKWIRQGDLFSDLYFRSEFTFVLFLAWVSVYYIFGGFWAIRGFCKDVISHKEILPLDPDRTGGLHELGRLSLDLDLIVALPSIAFPLYLLGREPEYLADISSGVWVGISVLYALILIFVFFVSISPAHDDMMKAKNNYLLKIHNEYKDMHNKILQKLEPGALIEPEEYKRLSGLYALYDRVKSMAVWPLDFQTTLRFSITSLLPIITVGITISIP